MPVAFVFQSVPKNREALNNRIMEKYTHLQINLVFARLIWNPAESPVCDVSRQLNVLHQAASLLKILRQPTTGFALLRAHQVGAVPEFPSALCSSSTQITYVLKPYGNLFGHAPFHFSFDLWNFRP
ncbi:hypothetical protein CSKR_108085 [Clonorchis sinensis]|uniref:Uncharacterized protein n=1 Tax=Clonorchis sinensis TaxID=79923 RepID=A0A419PMX2_CLOSI|nr:hypothetical protein CSKR_108085 [Clonorchis sinensis]